MRADQPPRRLEYILGLTAFTAGTIDIISFTKLGGIFASAMTGNLAFLGLYLARGAMNSAIGSAIALAGFVFGGAAGNLLTRKTGRETALNLLLGAESLLLAAVLATWFATPRHNGSPADDGLIILLSVSMGLQSILGKKINLSNIPTIVFTSTLTNIVISVTDMLATGTFRLTADTGRQLISFFLYFFGALSAGFFVYLSLRAVILLPAAAAFAGFMLQTTSRRRA